ncbi:MAG TPA: hypothetical protein VF618_00490 [Thermoanaerobaculia bacterium]
MSLTIWLVAAFLVAVAAAIYFNRRKLAEVQALIFGGSIVPGCVVAEAIVVLLIAVAFIVAANSGLI